MLTAMAIYVAEAYLSRARASDLESVRERLRDVLTVRHLFSYFVPEEETAFHVLQASTPDAVREALERAGVAPDRVVVAEAFGQRSIRGSG
jgi:beta-phosphoglucomutase-like phosphatase (HAD superfamily)